MKKVFMIALLAGSSFATFAQSGGYVSSVPPMEQGGFKGPGLVSEVMPVSQAKKMKNDMKVVLEGSIVRQIGNELYEFRDDSGTIYVDIDDNYWGGRSISPKDKVRIEVDIDKDWNSVEIDVKKITVVK